MIMILPNANLTTRSFSPYTAVSGAEIIDFLTMLAFVHF
jgi:hypothetical protein